MANQSKLFHMVLRFVPARSTLADAMNNRDWHIYQDVALRLMDRARTLYANQTAIAGLDTAVCALDSTTIDLCLNLFV